MAPSSRSTWSSHNRNGRVTSRSSGSPTTAGAMPSRTGPPGSTASTCRSSRAQSTGRSRSPSRNHRRPMARPPRRRASDRRRQPPRLPDAKMDLGLTDARALVGGGSGGLGGAIAQALRDEGARTGLIGRPGEKLQAAAERLDSVAVPADLSTPDGPSQAVEAAVAAFGGLDLLVVNSGGPPPGRFDELDEAAWQTAIDGTLWSSIRLLRAALPHLREGRDPGHPVELGARADPRAVRLEPAPAGAGRPHQVAGRGDRPGPDQRHGAGP